MGGWVRDQNTGCSLRAQVRSRSRESKNVCMAATRQNHIGHLPIRRAQIIAKAVQAHGGLETFKHIQSIDVAFERSGFLWPLKGYEDHTLVTATVQITPPKVTYTNLVGAQEDGSVKFVWTPLRAWKERADGTVMESRENLRASFEGQTAASPWDQLQLLHFVGQALWNYTCAPFYFTWPGFEFRDAGVEHIEQGQQWTALEVTFPDDMPTHEKVQKSYFDERGLLRRLDYNSEFVKAGPGAHLLFDHRPVDGIMWPMLRRVVELPQGIIDGGPTAVMLNFHEVKVTFRTEDQP